jgi:molecular chaperone GrpE
MSEEEQTNEQTGTPTASDAVVDDAAAKAPEARVEESAGGVSGPEQRIADLEGQLAKEHEAATDYMNRWQRAQADFANFRRRVQQDQERATQLAMAQALVTILPALDSFERAFETLPPTLRMYSWIDGVNLVYLQLRTALQAHGIQPVEVEPGHAFDPTTQEAIGEVETVEHPAGRVAIVVQRGYTVGDMLLRPALVQVARAPQAQAEQPEAATPETTADAGESGEAAGDEVAAP